MKSYIEFITEGKKSKNLSGRVMRMNSQPSVSINHADETIEGLRRKLLDHYFAKVKDNDPRETINKCVSTYVYALDKNLRIDSDIVDMLAKAAGETSKDTIDTLTKMTNDFYEKDPNHYGSTG